MNKTRTVSTKMRMRKEQEKLFLSDYRNIAELDDQKLLLRIAKMFAAEQKEAEKKDARFKEKAEAEIQ